MGSNVTPTSEEIQLQENDFLASKTDPEGRITYCNESFIHYSGYEEADLLNQAHDIIRHPNVPKSIYRAMWNNLNVKQEFFSVVPNLCKNGAYYWTFTNASPSFNVQNQLIGYYFTRRKPNQELIDFIEPIYRQMIEEEAKYSDTDQAMDASIAILDNAIAQHGLTYTEFIYTRAQ